MVAGRVLLARCGRHRSGRGARPRPSPPSARRLDRIRHHRAVCRDQYPGDTRALDALDPGDVESNPRPAFRFHQLLPNLAERAALSLNPRSRGPCPHRAPPRPAKARNGECSGGSPARTVCAASSGNLRLRAQCLDRAGRHFPAAGLFAAAHRRLARDRLRSLATGRYDPLSRNRRRLQRHLRQPGIHRGAVLGHLRGGTRPDAASLRASPLCDRVRQRLRRLSGEH